jgi:hypothetical protein
MIQAQLTSLGASTDLLAAGKILDDHLRNGTRPDWGLVCWVNKFLTAQGRQDRYGK